MHIPSIYREERLECLYELIATNPFGTLITISDGMAIADHIPLVLHTNTEGGSCLQGHVSIANPVWKSNAVDHDVLVIFQGDQSYISPSWYPSKQAHGKVVPTWNYMVVHARGKLVIKRDADWLLAHLNRLSDQQEAGRDMPWEVSDAPSDFIEKMMKGIVGIEIKITDLVGQWKLSQNKKGSDYDSVVDGLTTEGEPIVNNMVLSKS